MAARKVKISPNLGGLDHLTTTPLTAQWDCRPLSERRNCCRKGKLERKASAVPPTPLLGPVLVPPALMALIFGHRGLVKVSQTISGATVDDAAGQLFSISSYSQVTIGTRDLAKSLLPIVRSHKPYVGLL